MSLYKQLKKIPTLTIKQKLKSFFEEDQIINDITTNTYIKKNKTIAAKFISEFNGVFSGEQIIKEAFSKNVKVVMKKRDGEKIKNKDTIAELKGPSFEILKKERVVLNLIQRMSGVATETNKYVIKSKKIKILDTRKTTPGIRIFEKYAVKCGGGENHRFDLSKGFMVKDNHINSNGGISKTILKSQKSRLPLQVEIDNIKQLKECLNFSIDAVLLDNMSPQKIKECIKIIRESNKNIFIEVSGGINIKILDRFLIDGVNAISVGSIIHQAVFKNIKLEFL